MSTETINLPVMPSPAGGHSRRKSTGGFLKIKTTGAESMPNYLKPSTGSCHDVCKYGIQHVSETKPRTPDPKKYRENPDKSKYIGIGLYEYPANMMKPETSLKSPSKPKSQSAYNCEVIKEELPTPTKKIVVTPKPLSLSSKEISTLPNSESEIKPKVSKTLKGNGPSASAGLESDAKPKVLARLKDKGLSALSRPANGFVPKVSETLQGKGRGAPKPNFSDTKASVFFGRQLRKAYSDVVSAKKNATNQLRSLADSVKMKKGDSKKLEGLELDLTKLKNKHAQTVTSPSKTRRKSGFSEKSESEEMSVQKTQSIGSKFETEQSSDEKVPEKTLYVIEPEPENVKPSEENSIRYDHSHLEPKASSIAFLSESKQNEEKALFATDTKLNEDTSLNPESDDAEIKVPIDDKRTEEKRVLRRAATVGSKDGNCAPRKLKFREGRLLDIQPSGNNSPHKPKFRPVKLLGENKPASQKVSLKSRAKEAKETARSLYNKMIKDTASKLVQSRKSKVKALVGAFESVISLQDSKKQAPEEAT